MFVLNFVLLFVSLLSLSEAEIFSPFISNGQDAQITEFPYLVSIQEIDVHVCGGTLLNEKWILSAARCFAHRLITNLNIEYGHSEILPGPSGSNKALINSVISHEDYGTSPLVNDIALAESSIPINTGFHQPFVKLIVAGGSKFSSGTPSIHAGWGHIRLGVRTTILQKADADILSHQDCIEATEGTQKPSRNQICSIGKSVLCTSDLGSPLTVNGIQVGIASFRNGPACSSGEVNYPNVYTDVSYFIDWIEDKTRIDYQLNMFLS